MVARRPFGGVPPEHQDAGHRPAGSQHAQAGSRGAPHRSGARTRLSGGERPPHERDQDLLLGRSRGRVPHRQGRAGRESSLRTNLGVVAQSLRHLDMLARFTIEVELEGLRICVPTPEAYAVHKMAVNHERGRKQAKDAEAIERMWPHLDRGRLKLVLESCTRRERSRVDAFMAQHGLEF